MTEKAQHVLEKIALDFGTTRGLLRALKAGGGTLTRRIADSSSFERAVPEFEIPHRINIARNAANPRAAFFHEMGHFLDLRKATLPSLKHRDMLKAEQKANVIARRSIVNPAHRTAYEQIAQKNFKSYQTYAAKHPELKGLSKAQKEKKYPTMFRDAFGKATK